MTCKTDLEIARNNQSKWRRILQCPEDWAFTDWCIRLMEEKEELKQKIINLIEKYGNK